MEFFVMQIHIFLNSAIKLKNCGVKTEQNELTTIIKMIILA
ncbi:MAG: hypothetical protein RR247_02290 [Clostridia bacterium]